MVVKRRAFFVLGLHEVEYEFGLKDSTNLFFLMILM